MSLTQALTGLLLTGLALAHSIAGETGFIRPLLAAQWDIEVVPRWAADRLLRAAWHLTSVAWLGFAVITIGGTPVTAIAAASLMSAAIMFVGLPGHPAWPVFLLAGLFALSSEGLLTTPVLVAGTGFAIALAVALAALHLYWVAGGRVLVDVAVPTTADGDRTFSPGPVATAAVAVLLLGFAGLVAATATMAEPWIVRWAVLAGIAVLAARAIGDGRYAGFTKRDRDSAFGTMDDRWFTPIAVFLAVSSGASVLL